MSVRSRKVTEVEFSVRSTENSNLIPWPEWSDVELNSEKWGLPKNGPDGLFLDTASVTLPPSLEPFEWIRAQQLKNLTEPLTVYVPSKEYPDLITTNKHLLHSEFVRWFISALINLQYCGRNGLEISGESDKFFWNGREPWRGWMHIYSENKAGKGAHHRPGVNLNGKYIVRLYFMGCWRRIVVDDMIPVDQGGVPLLPTTSYTSELWPMLLAKALLKIASLTSTERKEIVDFHPITCLTGWICLSLDVMHLSPQDKWDFLAKYADHFECTSPEQFTTQNSPSKTTIGKEKAKEKGKGNAKGNTKMSAKDKRMDVLDNPRPVTLFVDLEDMKEVDCEVVPGLSPCWSHFIYVVQSRDVPLNPKDVKPPLEKWKLYRWLKWTIDRGLLDPAEYFVPIRCLRIVSPLKECKDHVVYIYEETEQEVEVQNETREPEVPSARSTKTAAKAKHTANKKVKEEEAAELPDDISFWADFNKMMPYVREVYLFYKCEYFKYVMHISDAFHTKFDEQKSKSTLRNVKKAESKRSSPSEYSLIERLEFEHTYDWPKSLKKSRNECLYLFCDSVESKVFLINFCSMQQHYISDNIDGTPAITSACSTYLIIQKHSLFYRSTDSETLVSICTAGTKSAIVELKEGRHVLRLYCRSESRCSLIICSDTIFYIGDRLKMHRLMSTESDRMELMVKNVSNAVAKAFLAFGTPDYSAALRNFYKSYMPDLTSIATTQKKMVFKQIHNYFMEELVDVIKRTFAAEEVIEIIYALRVFFLDPKIGSEYHRTISLILQTLKSSTIFGAKRQMQSSVGSEDWSYEGGEEEWIDYDRHVTVIQSFFRMVTVLQYKRKHDPNHSKHQQIQKDLMKIVHLFDYTKQESLAHVLLRTVIQRDEKFLEMYSCTEDFQHVIQVQEIKGILPNIRQNQWVPVVRLIVNSRDPQVVFAVIYLFVNLASYNVRVFDNETGHEISRIVNNVSPFRYRYNNRGYTVIGYGWSENFKTKDEEWMLHLVTIKGEPLFYLQNDQEPLSVETAIPLLVIEELWNTYIPNVRNLISKWKVNITQDSLLSLRFKTSYELVKIRLRFLNEKGDVILETDEGGPVVVLPLIYLRFEENNQLEISKEESSQEKENSFNSYTVYFIEAFVLNDSWPLTEAEWNVVSEAKLRSGNTATKGRFSASSRKFSKSDMLKGRRYSKVSIESTHLELPYWILQAVIDAGSGLEITQDRTREKEIAAIKESWALEDPERPQRAKHLRDAFLETYTRSDSSSRPSEAKLSSSSQVATRKETNGTSSAVSLLARVQATGPRTLKPPRPPNIFLPPLDLMKYVRKDEEVDDRWVKTEADEEMLRRQRAINVHDFLNTYEGFLQELSMSTGNQILKYRKILDENDANFWTRKIRMEDVYELRQSCVQSVKAELSTSTPKTKSKKK